MHLYNIFYLDNVRGDPPKYEATTNNFQKWLKEHNDGRIADGNEPKNTQDFRTESIYPIIYEDSNETKVNE